MNKWGFSVTEDLTLKEILFIDSLKNGNIKLTLSVKTPTESLIESSSSVQKNIFI